jgi:hypothetical protein
MSSQYVLFPENEICPTGFDKQVVMHQTPTNWQTAGSFLRWCTECFLPALRARRSQLGLPPSAKAVLLLDLYKTHQGPAALTLLKKNDVLPLFIDPSLTGIESPLDIQVNSVFKERVASAQLKNMLLKIGGDVQNLDLCDAESYAVKLSKLDLQKPFCSAVGTALAWLSGTDGAAMISKSFRVYQSAWFEDKQVEAEQRYADGKLFATSPSTRAQSAFAIAAQLPENREPGEQPIRPIADQAQQEEEDASGERNAGGEVESEPDDDEEKEEEEEENEMDMEDEEDEDEPDEGPPLHEAGADAERNAPLIAERVVQSRMTRSNCRLVEYLVQLNARPNRYFTEDQLNAEGWGQLLTEYISAPSNGRQHKPSSK